MKSREEARRKTHMIFISQSEKVNSCPIVFESINGHSAGCDVWDTIILDEYKTEDEWVSKIPEIIGEDGVLKEIHCFVDMPNYDFLLDAVFYGLSGLYLYDATKLTGLPFLYKMEKLNSLLIDSAQDLGKSKGMNDLIQFLKMQEKRYKELLKLPLEEQIKMLFDFPYLEALCIRGSGLKDLSMFSELTRSMHEINFSYNEIEDISPLAGLVSSYLFMSHNKISKGVADVVKKMSYPVDIYLRHNKIDDDEFQNLLNSKKEFIHIFLHHNLITDYKGLADRRPSKTDVTDEEMGIRRW